MDRRAIGGARHPSVERVDLAHQMTLAQPADRRIARHRPDLRGIEADERDARTQPRRGRGGLGSGVPPADDDDIEMISTVHDGDALYERRTAVHIPALFHVEHYLPMQKRPNSASSISSTPACPVIRSSAAAASRSRSANRIRSPASREAASIRNQSRASASAARWR